MVGTFIPQLIAQKIGDATTSTLRTIYTTKCKILKLEMAGVLDLEPIIKVTYILEGEGLISLLLVDKIEELRTFGSTLSPGTLTNSAAVLREAHELKVMCRGMTHAILGREHMPY